jgi:hypothetical protein
MAAKGLYFPKHAEKYVGDITKVTYRSSWERRFMEFCDNNVNILKWGSEEIRIPYLKPTTKKIHNYFPDFFIMYRNAKGDIVKEVIEIKPKKEAVMTKKSSTYDKVAIVINMAKWDAAKQFCDAHGMIFRILTEDSLFKTGKEVKEANKARRLEAAK